MTDNVSKIKDRLDVVDVLSGYMKLQKAGINFKGRCPFHNEKTPSFFVSPERQIWHCFGCQKGGDMFEFVKEIESVEFPEALKILADKAGIELELRQPADRPATDAKQKLYEICELATKFFEKQFQSSSGKEALAYLHDRGLTDTTITEFRLGWAPNDWESLSNYLQTRGYQEKEIIDAGLAIKRSAESGREGVYDRFRSRIMFPIFEITGQVVGFTARTFEPSSIRSGQPGLAKTGETMAKYINTPQTLIYDKSRVLYGLSKAKLDIKKSDRCILVEGNMDALMSFQAGVRNVVASSGTALTPTHLRLLQRYTKNLGFCFDTDDAGNMATRRGAGLAIGLALQAGFKVEAIEINDKECKDPADYVKKYGEKWLEVVASSRPFVEYYFNKARSLTVNVNTPEGQRKILEMVGPFIKNLSDDLEYHYWIQQLTTLFRLGDNLQKMRDAVSRTKDDLQVHIERGLKSGELAEKENPPPVILPREAPDVINEMILSLVLKAPALLRDGIINIPEGLVDERTMNIIRRVAKEPFDIAQGKLFEFKTFVASFSGGEALQLEFAHLRSQELWQGFDDETLKVEFHNLINTARRRSINARLTNLQFDVREAEANKDKNKLIQLTGEFNELARQLILTHHPYGQKEKNQVLQPADIQEKENIQEAGKINQSSEESQASFPQTENEVGV